MLLRFTFYAILCFVISGCNEFLTEIRELQSSDGNTVPEVFKVKAAYEETGEDWNSYVKDDSGTLVYQGTGTPCDGTEASYRDCVHAGELRKFLLPEAYTSCVGLTPSDSLEAFNWDCVSQNSRVTFYSTGLKSGKGLRDLIDFDTIAFKPNALLVTTSQGTAPLTPEHIWWPRNSVRELPTNSDSAVDTYAALNEPGVVYVLKTTRATQGYAITANGVSIVGPRGTTLQYAGGATSNCNATTGSAETPNLVCLIFSRNANSAWIEVNLNGSPASGTSARPVVLGNSRNFLFRNLMFQGAVTLNSVTNSKFENVKFEVANLTLSESSGNLVNTFAISRGYISLSNSHRNVISSGHISGTFSAIDISGTSGYNSISELVLHSLSGYGFQTTGTNTNNTFSHLTIANSNQEAIGHWNGTRSTIHNILGMNAGNQGIQISSSQVSISQIATTHARYRGIMFNAGATYGKQQGLLMAGNNGSGDCIVSGPPAGAALSATCVPQNLSTGVITVSGLSAATSVVGKVADDTANTSAVLGSATYPTLPRLFDWFGFTSLIYETQSLFRGWGRENTAAFPAAGHRSAWTSGAGRIWDFSLLASASVFRNITGNGTTQNAALSNGVACPAWLSGDDFLVDLFEGEVMNDGVGDDDGICEVGEACSGRHFLRNAREIIGDRIGNDNGLCESGEACIATPNIGAYQGHGRYQTSQCTFQDGATTGAVTGVTMHFYPINGVTP